MHDKKEMDWLAKVIAEPELLCGAVGRANLPQRFTRGAFASADADAPKDGCAEAFGLPGVEVIVSGPYFADLKRPSAPVRSEKR